MLVSEGRSDSRGVTYPFRQTEIGSSPQLGLVFFCDVKKLFQYVSFRAIMQRIPVSCFFRIKQCKSIMMFGSNDEVLCTCISKQVHP